MSNIDPGTADAFDSNHARHIGARKALSDQLAVTAYWLLSRAARLGSAGADVANWPLSDYRVSRFRALRADSLDRFGSGLEQRFTGAEIEAMMGRAGISGIRFFEGARYWMAVGFKGVAGQTAQSAGASVVTVAKAAPQA